MTQDQLAARFGPSQKAYDDVLAYLQKNGFTLAQGSANRLTLTVKATRAQAEQTFAVNLDDYQLDGKGFYANDQDPAVPAKIAKDIAAVAGLSNLAQPSRPACNPGPVCSAQAISENAKIIGITTVIVLAILGTVLLIKQGINANTSVAAKAVPGDTIQTVDSATYRDALGTIAKFLSGQKDRRLPESVIDELMGEPLIHPVSTGTGTPQPWSKVDGDAEPARRDYGDVHGVLAERAEPQRHARNLQRDGRQPADLDGTRKQQRRRQLQLQRGQRRRRHDSGHGDGRHRPAIEPGYSYLGHGQAQDFPQSQ